ncbi:hypothetical protein HK414_23520 [Ramlibacter terrae]|uniref:Tail specific protease domain-containing protein n=1 Tax=Ramlibacter terrae TaxID=2732511 RepID=A0ABX6P579_9BURK|nr:hypothetical protein HK414_23520 [Ramlibacter terrae]
MQKLVLAALAASTVLLAACGGGGGGGSTTSGGGDASAATSDDLAGMCSLPDQKRFVRAYLDEAYLWYREIRDVDAANYSSVPAYFDALLVRTPDANGLPKDRYSTVLPTGAAQDLLKDHTNAVPVTRVVRSPEGRRTGYIQFNDHESGAQDDLITTFRELRDGGVQDLVLDLRFNSGGFLYVALAAASMIAGPSAEGKVFEQLRYNDKRNAETASSTLTFSSRLQFAETQYASGSRLPQLDLPRVYVLTSGQTCSASESIVNSLRGIDLQVVLVGDTTCGKPYGFRRRDNCGYAYFPIEFGAPTPRASATIRPASRPPAGWRKTRTRPPAAPATRC